ncbi:MAG: hypothetical protein ABWK53_07065 [Anaerolineales bacterium]
MQQFARLLQHKLENNFFMDRLSYKPFYRRNLPHIQPEGATLFVTFRLAGSLPQRLIREWQEEKRHENRFTPEQKRGFERRWFGKFEEILNHPKNGPRWLQDERVAGMVAESIRYRDGKVYRLDAFCIMSTHVHMVFAPLPDPNHPGKYISLASIMHSLKSFTAHEANRILAREGPFWAHESFDHYIRNQDEWERIVWYVLQNPVKAGLVKEWQDWKWTYLAP